MERFIRRGFAFILSAVALSASLSYAQAIEKHNPNKIWETEPHLSFDDTQWVLRRPIMITQGLFAGKLTHDEHWQRWSVDPNFNGTKMDGDPNMMGRSNIFDAIRISIGPKVGGWSRVFKVEPEDPEEEFKIAWGVDPKSCWGQELRIVPRKGKPLLILQGPGSYWLYALERYHRDTEVKLKISGPFDRYDPSLEGDLI